MRHDFLMGYLSRRGSGRRKIPRIMTADEGGDVETRRGWRGRRRWREGQSWGGKVVQPDPFGQTGAYGAATPPSWRVPANYTP